MSDSLLRLINNADMRKSLKPETMSQAEYEQHLITVFNRCKDNKIDDIKFRRQLKIRLAVSRFAGV